MEISCVIFLDIAAFGNCGQITVSRKVTLKDHSKYKVHVGSQLKERCYNGPRNSF